MRSRPKTPSRSGESPPPGVPLPLMAGCRNLCCSGLRGLPRLLGRGAPEEPKSKEKETGDSTENSVAGANTATDAQSNAEGSEFCGFLSKPEPCPIQAKGGQKVDTWGGPGGGFLCLDVGCLLLQGAAAEHRSLQLAGGGPVLRPRRGGGGDAFCKRRQREVDLLQHRASAHMVLLIKRSSHGNNEKGDSIS